MVSLAFRGREPKPVEGFARRFARVDFDNRNRRWSYSWNDIFLTIGQRRGSVSRRGYHSLKPRRTIPFDPQSNRKLVFLDDRRRAVCGVVYFKGPYAYSDTLRFIFAVVLGRVAG